MKILTDYLDFFSVSALTFWIPVLIASSNAWSVTSPLPAYSNKMATDITMIAPVAPISAASTGDIPPTDPAAMKTMPDPIANAKTRSARLMCLFTCSFSLSWLRLECLFVVNLFSPGTQGFLLSLGQA